MSNTQELIALCITHGKEILKESIEAIPDILNCLYNDALYPVNSKEEGYNFTAMHLEPAYNCYSEHVSCFLCFLPFYSFS